ncbi:MAG: hypothetical protein U0992_19565 [Planctomycetaceae bacterium]
MQAAPGSFISSTYWTDGIGPAALATLDVLKHPWVSRHARKTGEQFRQGMAAIAKESGVPLKLGGLPATNTIGFDHPQSSGIVTLLTVRMLNRGFLAGSGFYPTLAHEDAAGRPPSSRRQSRSSPARRCHPATTLSTASAARSSTPDLRLT